MTYVQNQAQQEKLEWKEAFLENVSKKKQQVLSIFYKYFSYIFYTTNAQRNFLH